MEPLMEAFKGTLLTTPLTTTPEPPSTFSLESYLAKKFRASGPQPSQQASNFLGSDVNPYTLNPKHYVR